MTGIQSKTRQTKNPLKNLKIHLTDARFKPVHFG